MEPIFNGHETIELQDNHVEDQLASMIKAEKNEKFRQKTDVYRRLNPDGTSSPLLQLQKKGSPAAGFKRDPAQGNQLVKV